MYSKLIWFIVQHLKKQRNVDTKENNFVELGKSPLKNLSVKHLTFNKKYMGRNFSHNTKVTFSQILKIEEYYSFTSQISFWGGDKNKKQILSSYVFLSKIFKFFEEYMFSLIMDKCL